MKIFIKMSLLILLLNSCNNDYKVIETKVVKGVISAKDEGRLRTLKLPRFYVQSAKETVTIDVPFENENLFNVGDTICIVVKTIEKIK